MFTANEHFLILYTIGVIKKKKRGSLNCNDGSESEKVLPQFKSLEFPDVPKRIFMFGGIFHEYIVYH